MAGERGPAANQAIEAAQASLAEAGKRKADLAGKIGRLFTPEGAVVFAGERLTPPAE